MSEGSVPFLDPRKTSCFVKTLLRSGSSLTQKKTTMNNFTDLYHMFSKPEIPRGGSESEEKPSEGNCHIGTPLPARALPHFPLHHLLQEERQPVSGVTRGPGSRGNLAVPSWLGPGQHNSHCSSFRQTDFPFFTKGSRKAAVLAWTVLQ